MTAPARTAAYHALRAIAAHQQDLPAALAAARTRLHDDRDRSLTLDIVTGTLRWQRSLDHLIEHFARRPVKRIEPEVLMVLRLSAYQILHLDRVPVSAIVDDAVDLTREARKPGASGFVNGVLRALVRQRRHLPLPPRPEDVGDRDAALAYLGVTHSHPDWLVERWLDRFGFENAERWVQFNNRPPRLTLRVNTLRGSVEEAVDALRADGVETERTVYAPSALGVVSGNPLRQPQDGRWVVQDEASQLVTLVVNAKPGERVLDLCAAPGGKTTAMAAEMADDGLLLACDVRARRVRLLRDAVALSGAGHVRLVQLGTAGALPFAARFDRVLVDAPCSGLGTIRRDPDIRWRRTAEELPGLAAAQRNLIERAAEVVRPGGRLVYATCSSEPEENEQVVDAFLAGRQDFELVDLRGEPSLPATLRPVVDARGMFRTLPHAHGLEAFFAAALRRR